MIILSKNRKNKFAIFSMLIVCIVVVFYFGNIYNVGKDNNITKSDVVEIKIGSISPLSGDNAKYGKSMIKVLDYKLNKINKDFATKKIKFILYHKDGQCDKDKALEAYNELKYQGIKFIIGGFCSSETLSFVPKLSQDIIVVVSPGSSSLEIEGLSPYLFSLSYSEEVAIKEVANLVIGYEKIGIISDDLKKLNQSIQIIKEVNLETEISSGFISEKTNLAYVLENIKKSEVEALLLIVDSNKITTDLIRAMQETKPWSGVKLIGNNTYLNKEIIDIDPVLLDGMIVVGAPKVISNRLGIVLEDIEKNKGNIFISEYYVASSMDSLQLLANSIVENVNLEEDVEQTEEEIDINKEVVSVSDVIDTIIDRRHKGYSLGALDFRNTNFSYELGVGIYRIEDGVAVFNNNTNSLQGN